MDMNRVGMTAAHIAQPIVKCVGIVTSILVGLALPMVVWVAADYVRGNSAPTINGMRDGVEYVLFQSYGEFQQTFLAPMLVLFGLACGCFWISNLLKGRRRVAVLWLIPLTLTSVVMHFLV